jgi:hypothetical protein
MPDAKIEQCTWAEERPIKLGHLIKVDLCLKVRLPTSNCRQARNEAIRLHLTDGP